MSEWDESRLSGHTLSRDRVIEFLRKGRTVQAVADLAGWPRPHVMRAGFEAGLRLVPSRDVMSAEPAPVPAQREPIGQAAALQRLIEPTRATEVATAAISTLGAMLEVDDVAEPAPEVAQSAPEPSPLSPPKREPFAIERQLDELAHHADASVREYAGTAARLLVQLRDRLDELADVDRQRAAQLREKADARIAALARIEAEQHRLNENEKALRAELARIEAELAGDVTPPVSPPGPQDSPAPAPAKKKPWRPASGEGVAPWSQIRAWCLTNGVPCSTHGKLGDESVRAFLAAHPDLRAPS